MSGSGCTGSQGDKTPPARGVACLPHFAAATGSIKEHRPMTTTTMPAHTVCTLTSGLRVANFSSHHPGENAFVFEDGTVLANCSPERSKTLELRIEEVEVGSSWPGTRDIELRPIMTDIVRQEIKKLEEDTTIDIVLVPLLVMVAAKADHMPCGKMRVQRSTDRVTKRVSCTTWCV